MKCEKGREGGGDGTENGRRNGRELMREIICPRDTMFGCEQIVDSNEHFAIVILSGKVMLHES